jgi:hypothetical protein
MRETSPLASTSVHVLNCEVGLVEIVGFDSRCFRHCDAIAQAGLVRAGTADGLQGRADGAAD